VAETYLGISLDSTPRSTGQLELEMSDSESDREDLAGAAGRRAAVAGLLAPVLTKRLSADGLERLHDESERPLERVSHG